jgi:Major Facilitator Superfamily
MDVIWERTELSFRTIFGCLSLLVAISAVGSFFLWPDAAYEIVELGEEARRGCANGDDDKKLLEFETATDSTRGDELEQELLLEQSSSKQDVDEEKLPRNMDLTECSFQEQLSSGVYIRLSIFFLVSSWWANFYIATVTTELGDLQRFDLAKQHEMARLLSFIDAGAIIFAPLSGYLLDSAGFAVTAVITITLGIAQMIFLLMAGSRESFMIASFVSYAVFRAFMFPYYFASLSKKLGFRFFGILSGVSFCASGISQLAIAPLAVVVEGTCHEFDDINEMSCDQGEWAIAHAVQISTLVALLLIPVVDTCSIKRQQHQQRMLAHQLLHSSTSPSSYGSVSKHDDTELTVDSDHIY